MQSPIRHTAECDTISGLFARHSQSRGAPWPMVLSMAVNSAWVGGKIFLFKERI